VRESARLEFLILSDMTGLKSQLIFLILLDMTGLKPLLIFLILSDMTGLKSPSYIFNSVGYDRFKISIFYFNPVISDRIKNKISLLFLIYQIVHHYSQAARQSIFLVYPKNYWLKRLLNPLLFQNFLSQYPHLFHL
jgi:hypothetical protein